MSCDLNKSGALFANNIAQQSAILPPGRSRPKALRARRATAERFKGDFYEACGCDAFAGLFWSTGAHLDFGIVNLGNLGIFERSENRPPGHTPHQYGVYTVRAARLKMAQLSDGSVSWHCCGWLGGITEDSLRIASS